MNRWFSIALFFVLALAPACTKSSFPAGTPWTSSTISVSVANESASTKVGYELEDGVYKMYWRAGDKIQFANLSDGANVDACLVAAQDGASTSFSGNIKTWLGRSDVVAIYPQVTGLRYSDGSLVDPKFGPQHLLDNKKLTLNDQRVYVQLPNNATDNVSVVPGSEVANGVYVALGHGALAESQSNYYIPALQFRQATCLINADFSAFSKPVSKVLFSSNKDLFYSAFYVNPETAEADWPEGVKKSAYRRSSLAYSVIRDNGETSNSMYLPMFPAKVEGQSMEIWVTAGDERHFLEDVQEYVFEKTCKNFERNKMYSLTLDPDDGYTEPAPAIQPAELTFDGSAVSFSYAIPDKPDNFTSYLCTAADSSSVIATLGIDELDIERYVSTMSASGEFTGLSYGTTYWLISCAKDDYYSKWVSQSFVIANPLPAVPTVTLNSASKYSSRYMYLKGTCKDSNVTEVGFCYSQTNHTPTIDDTKIKATRNSSGAFTSYPGVTQNRTYYVRAYAINAGGVGYSSVKTVKM